MDRYREIRGGDSKILSLSCANCGTFLLVYQKDGPGILKRLYMDRIFSPDELIYKEQIQFHSVLRVPQLKCSSCGTFIARPYIYEKEKRPAFLLKRGTTVKKVLNSKK